MTFRAKMVNGQVVFEGGIKPAEGVELRVDIVEPTTPTEPASQKETVGQRMLKYAGTIDDPSLPTDGSLNHDHYIYGAPKR